MRNFLLIFVCFFTIEVVAQESDSCQYNSHLFMDDSNLCNGIVLNSFRWLTQNCIIKGSTTVDEAEKIFGKGNLIKRRTVSYQQHDPKNPNNPNRWFDYYWVFGLFFFCDESGNINSFPSDRGAIFFKKDIVVGFKTYSIG